MLGAVKDRAKTRDFFREYTKKAASLTPPPLRAGAVVFRFGTERPECTMLRIYIIVIEIVREVRPIADRIARFDRDLSRQLRKASVSVALNVSEASGTSGGRRRNTYEIALGEARETRACLDAAEAVGYISKASPELRDKLDRVIATLWKVTR